MLLPKVNSTEVLVVWTRGEVAGAGRGVGVLPIVIPNEPYVQFSSLL